VGEKWKCASTEGATETFHPGSFVAAADAISLLIR
jgi:hypothetical protein